MTRASRPGPAPAILEPGRMYKLPSGRIVMLDRLGRAEGAQCRYCDPSRVEGLVTRHQVTFRREWLARYGSPLPVLHGAA